jgi:hypothetical protein
MEIVANSLEFNLFLILSIGLVVGKIILSIYLAIKIYQRTKEREEFRIDFIFGVFILMLGFFISRILLIVVDFFLTQFNGDLYYLSPNIGNWKIGNFIAMCGVAFLLFVIDKNILKFRLKGFLAYFYLALGLLALFWPVSSRGAYTLVSGIFMIAQLITIILPIIFSYLGIKIPSLRETAFIMAIGIILYMLGTIIISDLIIGAFRAIFGENVQVIVILIYLILKLLGLTLFIYGTAKFSMS